MRIVKSYNFDVLMSVKCNLLRTTSNYFSQVIDHHVLNDV